jgi:ATP-binding cassette subfamily C protein
MKQIIRRIIKILSKEQLKRLRPILALTFVVSLFEILVIGSIIPLLLFLTDPSVARNKISKLPGLTSWIPGFSDNELIWGTIALFSMLLVIKSSLSIILAYMQSDYTYHVQADLSKTLLNAITCQPLNKIQSVNSATHLQITINEANAFTHIALIPMSILITEISAVALIIVGIVVFEPYGALMICILFGIPGYLYYRYSKEALVRFGEIRRISEGQKLKTAKEVLGAIREIKLYNASDYFIGIFSRHCANSADISHKQGFIHSLPRYIFEFFSIASVIVLISVFLLMDFSRTEIISAVGLFGGAAFRLMPSINRILNSTGNLKFAKQTVDSIYEILRVSTFIREVNCNDFVHFFKRISIVNLT